MAVFGTIIVGAMTLVALVPRYGLSHHIAVDGGALFAVVGQFFGYVGSLEIVTQLFPITHSVAVRTSNKTCGRLEA